MSDQEISNNQYDQEEAAAGVPATDEVKPAAAGEGNTLPPEEPPLPVSSSPDETGKGDEKRPISPRKLEANRENAKRSTGPTSPEGKAKSAQNATKHGIFAKQFLLGVAPENVEETATLVSEVWEHFQPVGTLEQLFVQKIAVEIDRRARIFGIEQKMFLYQHNFFDPVLDRVVRYSVSADRAFYRSIQELERIQAERKARESGGAAAHPDSVLQASDSPAPQAK